MMNNNEWFDTRPGEHCLIRVAGADTNGVYSVVEILSDHLDGTPMCVHQNEDECIFVLEGMSRIAYGDKIFELAAGSAITLNRGHSTRLVQSFRVASPVVGGRDARRNRRDTSDHCEGWRHRFSGSRSEVPSAGGRARLAANVS
jgi:mannose-6-phosphate isomerase-like protein (cupin superfamily)